MKTPFSFSYMYIGADLFLIAVSSYMGGFWLINTQVAFISSMFITYASFFSYKKMIDKRVENGEKIDIKDDLDKIDDKHELFEENELIEEDVNVEEFKKIVKEERKKVSNIKQSGKNLFSSLTGMLSPLRLLAYVFLFISFLYLNRHGIFDVFPFLFGLGVVPIVTLIMSGFRKL